MSAIEHLAGRRRLLLLLAGLSFAAWQLAELKLVRAATEEASMRVVPVAIFAWGASMLALLFWGRQARRRAALDDELTQHNRRLAFGSGFWAMLLAAVAGMALSHRSDIAAADVARLILLVGVVTPTLWFLFLERPNAVDE